jgi:uncharacterized Fe-S cluster-containing protein
MVDDIFYKGNKITTNRINCLEILDVNESDIVCKNLLDGEFHIFSKTEHKYENVDIKILLVNSLIEILNDIEIKNIDKDFILTQMSCRISKWL